MNFLKRWFSTTKCLICGKGVDKETADEVQYSCKDGVNTAYLCEYCANMYDKEAKDFYDESL